jgi:hypothetical protein
MAEERGGDSADLLAQVQAVIVSLRRGENVATNWADFQSLVEKNIDIICKEFNTRWLTSICETYVDFAEPITSANALLISVIVKMEKLAQTYAHWRLGYPDTLAPPPNASHRKISLWDGVRSFHLEIGDAPNTMFGRVFDQLAQTPALKQIMDAVIERLKVGDTILGNLNKQHGHVFEPDYAWILGEKYRPLRESGRIPFHRYSQFLAKPAEEPGKGG